MPEKQNVPEKFSPAWRNIHAEQDEIMKQKLGPDVWAMLEKEAKRRDNEKMEPEADL